MKTKKRKTIHIKKDTNVLTDLENELKKNGYNKYILNNGEIWMSKGCPCCCQDRVLIKKDLIIPANQGIKNNEKSKAKFLKKVSKTKKKDFQKSKLKNLRKKS